MAGSWGTVYGLGKDPELEKRVALESGNGAEAGAGGKRGGLWAEGFLRGGRRFVQGRTLAIGNRPQWVERPLER